MVLSIPHTRDARYHFEANLNNPMEDLTQRQIDILRSIIQEYTETGEAVGSEILEKKYKLGVSPATIRNEMVTLA